jgi:superfamily II DNA or RNA helicase/HKD family nuclease/diadenosine tetraphosphate (Ap4A) HIT family hydrolase
VFSNSWVVALWDGFPVSPGHLLIVPRRHVATWFEANEEEQREIWQAIEKGKEAICQLYQPDGFNIGINVGEAAGQTVPHLHLHIIPRYQGDVPDPRGGVRYVIPHKANYLKPTPASSDNTLVKPETSPANETVRVQHQHGDDLGKITKVIPKSPVKRSADIGDSALVRGERDPLLPHLQYELETATAADLSVAFIQRSGVELLRPYLIDMLQRNGTIRILTGDYMNVTDPDALAELLDLDGPLQLRVFQANAISFHPKAYLFQHADQQGTAFVGSSNLSHSALRSGIEWNYRVYKSTHSDGYQNVREAFEELWHHPQTCTVTPEWIAEYRIRRAAATTIQLSQLADNEQPTSPPQPNAIQIEALAALEECRRAGQQAGLVVLATGLGKTWLSAFDSQRPEFQRILFVAHRDEILQQALHTFRTIRPDARLGKYSGTEKVPDADILFASIQTLGQSAHLKQFAPEAFDYIVVDEFHHAAASTYRRLIDYFTPKFMLGLTATPERSDGGDLLGLCGGNLVFRCDLVRGIREELLSTFRYFGVPDQVDYAQIPWRSQRFDDEALTAAVATQERARNALELYRQHGARRGLGFCCSMRHADFMAAYFEAQGVRAVAVHSGPTSAPRALSLERLARGELDILFAVDVFNEGLDIPNIDTILMLRPTESAIIWLQQFGRGLRKAVGKDHVRVIDYIGNHKTFLLKVKSLLQPICGMLPTDASLRQAIERVTQGEMKLPAGCEITYDLEAIDILDRLLKRDGQDAIDLWVSDFVEQQGARPQLSELQNAGLNPRALFTKYGSWFGYLEYRHAQQPVYLSGQDVRLIEQYRAWWRELCITAMTKSFKMLVLLGMQHQNAWSRKMSWEELAIELQRLAPRWKGVREEIAVDIDDVKKLARYVRDNPGKAWGGGEYFSSDSDGLQLKLGVADEDAEAFGEMVREVAEWRLRDYFERGWRSEAGGERGIRLKLMQAKGRVILKLPQKERDHLPQGEVVVMIDGEEYIARFAKEYVNVLRRGEENVLSELMRGWFGSRAGERGTKHEVRVWNDGVWRMGKS